MNVMPEIGVPHWSFSRVSLTPPAFSAICATKFPKKGKFGYHEYFHSSVLLGHLVSMGFDLHLLGLF